MSTGAHLVSALPILFLVLTTGHPQVLAEMEDRGTMVGPVPLRIISPVRNLFFQFTPERAVPLGKGRWGARLECSESNTNHPPKKGAREYDPIVNLELTRFNLSLRYGLAEAWEIGFEVPVMYMHGGFLDEPIRAIEDLFGAPKPRRTFERDDLYGHTENAFIYEISRDGETFLRGKDNAFGIGDIALTAKRRVLDQEGWTPGLAARGALKVPTGDEDEAFGSGRADAALGLAADWDFTRWGINLNLNTTSPMGNRLDDYGLDTQPIVSGHLGFEYRTSAKFSWHLDFAGTMGPYSLDDGRAASPAPPGGTEGLTGRIVQVRPAFAWRPRRNATLFIGFDEDLFASEDAAADLTLFMIFDYRFGKAR